MIPSLYIKPDETREKLTSNPLDITRGEHSNENTGILLPSDPSTAGVQRLDPKITIPDGSTVILEADVAAPGEILQCHGKLVL